MHLLQKLIHANLNKNKEMKDDEIIENGMLT